MRVLGIDPGLRNLGWGIIDVEGSRMTHVANGICHSAGDDLSLRLLALHQQLTAVLEQYRQALHSLIPEESYHEFL